MGGNQISDVFRVCHCLPATLLHLDLSFSEGLMLKCGSFIALPQLTSLCLDGCGLTFTAESATSIDLSSIDPIAQVSLRRYLEDMDGSIFTGLLSLETLSLKENVLSDVGKKLTQLAHTHTHALILPYDCLDMALRKNLTLFTSIKDACRGLAYFAQVSAPTLQDIRFADNENFSRDSIVKALDEWGLLSLLHSMDGTPVGAGRERAAAAMSGLDTRALLQRSSDSGAGIGPTDDGSAIPGGGMDALEKEFLMAIKGERDDTVVS